MRLADKRLIDVLDVLMKEDIAVRGMVLRVDKSGEVQLVECEYEEKPEEIPQRSIADMLRRAGVESVVVE